jgi:Cytosol aminopeptidase family, N-terminal domain
MAVSFLASDLGKWDQLESAPETLVLPFFSDERPLRGAAGLCDWRLCGRLSRMLQAGRVGGQLGEATLYPPGKRLPFARLLLVGLGAADRFDEAAAKKASAVIADRMRRLTRGRYALVPPGRSTGRLSARRALEIYLEAAGGDGDLVIVESVAGQKEAAEVTRARFGAGSNGSLAE